MRMYRLYTGNDGQSHFEELPASFSGTGLVKQSDARRANSVMFSRMEAGSFLDWHNAPRRQFVVVLSGMIEIGLGDGSLHRFAPGEGFLAEDLTGKGHTIAAVGNEPRIAIIVPLD